MLQLNIVRAIINLRVRICAIPLVRGNFRLPTVFTFSFRYRTLIPGPDVAYLDVYLFICKEIALISCSIPMLTAALPFIGP